MPPAYTTTTRSGIHVPTSANNGTDLATGLLQMANEQDDLWFPGMLSATARAAAPAGWLLCDGSSVLRATYAALFTAIGGTSSPYGLPDGTHFNLPDLRGRVPVGQDSTGARLANAAGRNLGQAGGEERHTLTDLESGVNRNGVTGNPIAWAKLKYRRWALQASVAVGVGGDPVSPAASPQADAPLDVEGDQNHGHALTQRDADNPHNNMQPYQVVNWLVKT